jgi:hypothetical protein
MSDQEKTRRETLKLAAAVAAFGTALGYRQTVDAAGKTEVKLEAKVTRLEMKLFDGDRLVHSCPVPPGELRTIKFTNLKLEGKIYLNGQAWDVKTNRAM